MSTTQLGPFEGCTYGHLYILAERCQVGAGRVFEARCACGNLTTQKKSDVLLGSIVSCGCHKQRLFRERNTSHGLSHLPEHQLWRSMKARCYNPKEPGFKDYGARGIAVCDRWRESFAAYLADMGPRPSPHHSIDRIDVNGNYEPGNCRWATTGEQARNTRRTVMVTHDGVTMCAKDWSVKLGLEQKVVAWRLRNGWSVERAVTTPNLNVGHRPRSGSTRNPRPHPRRGESTKNASSNPSVAGPSDARPSESEVSQ